MHTHISSICTNTLSEKTFLLGSSTHLSLGRLNVSKRDNSHEG